MKFELFFIGIGIFITLVTFLGDFYKVIIFSGILIAILNLIGLLEKP